MDMGWIFLFSLGITSSLEILFPFCCKFRMAASAEIKKIFDEIATKYQWDDKVRDFMMAREGLGAERIEDFRMAVTDVGQWEGVLAKVKGLEQSASTNLTSQASLGWAQRRR